MCWQKILFVTGLMTLMTLTHAGGHHIKSYGEDKDHIQGGSEDVPEGILPLPYSFDIKTGTAYGTRVSREEVGDSDGTVKGFYTIDGPRGTKRIVEYRADDSGFHANIQTSEPNIKSHNPSNVVIESISNTGKINDGLGLHHTAALPVLPLLNVDAAGSVKSVTNGGVKTIVTQGSEQGIKTFTPGGLQVRDPVAFPVLTTQVKRPVLVPIENQPQPNPNYRRKLIKTVRRKVVPRPIVVGDSSGRKDISKTNVDVSEEHTEALPDSKRVAPVRPDVVKGSQEFLGNVPYITIDGGLNDAGKEVVVLEDGSIVEAADVTRNIGKVPESVEQSKSVNINKDIRYSRGPQVPLKDILLNSKDQTSEQTRKIIPDRKLTVIKQETPIRTSIQTSSRNEGFRDGGLGGPILVSGGPGGAPISLTQDEIQSILSSGGVIEFPDNHAIGSFGGKDVLPSEKQLITPASLGGVTTTEIKKQTITQTLSSGKPATRISSALNRKKIDLNSQTSFASGPNAAQVPITRVSTGPIVVPGGPGGTSLSLTEGEIQNILSSGGIVDFPSDSSVGSVGAKDVFLSQRQPSLPLGYSKPKLNVQSITQTTIPRKPATVITPALDRKTEFKSQTYTRSGPTGAQPGLPRGPINIPGGPGGASLSLTEAEIENILNSGGIVDFPSNPSVGSFGAKDILISQERPSVIPGTVTSTRTNVQSVTQTSSARKPATRITPVLNRRTDLSQTYYRSGPIGAQFLRPELSRGPIIVPGGPGGASLSLSQDEIQNILSSGGIVDFPSNPSVGYFGARDVLISQNQPARVPGSITSTRSNVQSIVQTSNVRKPATRTGSALNRQTQTSFTSGPNTAGIPVPRITTGPITVPGGPGGSSLSLTEAEIENILSSGGIVDFPSNPSVGSFGAKDVLKSQERPSVIPGTVTSTRTNVQSVTQASSARKPSTRITPVLNRRTDISQTYYRSGPIGAQFLRPELSRGPIIVPGGPGGASLSLSQDEIQNILSSGGVVDFPSYPSVGYFGARDVLISQNQPARVPGSITSTRSNVQSIVQTSDVRKPATRTSPALNRQTQTSFTSGPNIAGIPVPRITTGPIVVPGGPGGASLSLTEGEIQNILSSGGIVDFPSDPSVGSKARDTSISQRQPSSTLGYVKPTLNVQSITQTSSARKPASPTYTRSGPIGAEIIKPELTSGPINIPGGPGGASLSLTEDEIQNILSSGGVIDFPTNTNAGSYGARDVLIPEKKSSVISGSVTRAGTNLQPAPQISNQRNPATEIISEVDSKNAAKQFEITSSVKPKPLVVNRNIFKPLNSQGIRRPDIFSNSQTIRGSSDIPLNRGPQVLRQNSNQLRKELILKQANPVVTQEHIETVFQPAEQSPHRIEPDVKDQQKHLQVEDILAPQLPHTKVIHEIDPEKSISGDNSAKYLHGGIPLNRNYYPPSSFMAPFNYEAPQINVLRANYLPFKQEQQKLEQILI